jgi:hypothetical protein
MSCCGDNWLVPSANPNNVPGGVESIIAGTPNVTIGGTSTVPSISVTSSGGVTELEGLTGNINLSGVGITIAGGSPEPGDITLTAAVQNVTGIGGATVTQPTPGTFQVNVPTALLPPLNNYITMNGQVGSGSFTLNNGSPPVYLLVGFPAGFPPSYDAYSFVDVDVNVTISGTGSGFFGTNSCQFGFVRGSTNIPGTLQTSPQVNAGSLDPYVVNLGYIRVPASQFANPPGGPLVNLYLYIVNSSTNATVNFKVMGLGESHRITITN